MPFLAPFNLLPLGGAVALAFFIPVLCILSVWIKQHRVEQREDAAWRTDSLSTTRYFQNYRKNKLHNIVSETWFPILVIFLFSIYFTYLLVYTPQLNEKGYQNFLLLGHFYMSGGAGDDAYLRQSFAAMCFAYLGWYVWTISTIFSRLVTMELVAATYYNVLVRLVVAVFVALMFNHLQGILFPSGTTYGPEAIGFGAGLFPDAALASLNQKLRKMLLESDPLLETFPLDLIQGVSPFRKLRLFEMGLDNCENLAAANAVELFLKSNLKLVEVVDWIGQAQLAVLVGSKNFVTMQSNGYRTVIDLHRGAGSPALPVLAKLLNYEEAQVTDLAAGVETDPSFISLTELRGHLNDPPDRVARVGKHATAGAHNGASIAGAAPNEGQAAGQPNGIGAAAQSAGGPAPGQHI